MVVLMIAIVVYGSWFLMAQSVQSLASEGARAAIGGLDASEREA
ncbi:pilus assembly protein, partial [Limosilactobacillus sp. c10Ua_36]|nr:pilus assembly protein [Limosilactobacillus sp. c10Ua_36]